MWKKFTLHHTAAAPQHLPRMSGAILHLILDSCRTPAKQIPIYGGIDRAGQNGIPDGLHQGFRKVLKSFLKLLLNVLLHIEQEVRGNYANNFLIIVEAQIKGKQSSVY